MGGAEEFMSDLLSELQNEGITVKAYTTYLPFAAVLHKKGVTAQTLPVVFDVVGDWKGLTKAILLWPLVVWQYQKILKNNNTDLLLFSGFNEKIIGSFLGKLRSVPVVWIEFGPMQPLLQKFGRLPKLLYYVVKKIPEKVIVPSKNTFDHLISGPHISLAKSVVIPCGRKSISTEFFRKIKKSPAPSIVCVSRLEKGKGQDLLIKAFVQVKKRIPKAQLIIVGEGNFQANLEKLITDLKLSANVTLTGRVPNALTEMAKADLCVFPSVWPLEGFGLVLLEAMALGKPVVAFDHSPGNEIVINGQTGLLAKSGDIQDLASKMINLLENPALGKKLGLSGKKRFLATYTIKKCAQQFYSTLNEGYVQSKAKKLLKDIG
jgi:glycosyltransferase involved in cell wall biosynthesis